MLSCIMYFMIHHIFYNSRDGSFLLDTSSTEFLSIASIPTWAYFSRLPELESNAQLVGNERQDLDPSFDGVALKARLRAMHRNWP